jgi:hypothetical protein
MASKPKATKPKATRPKVTVSTQPANRLTGAERRAARTASLATQQAELKQEAAARREERANKSAADARAGRPDRPSGQTSP